MVLTVRCRAEPDVDGYTLTPELVEKCLPAVRLSRDPCVSLHTDLGQPEAFLG